MKKTKQQQLFLSLVSLILGVALCTTMIPEVFALGVIAITCFIGIFYEFLGD